MQEPDQLLAIGDRHLGAANAEAYGERDAVPPEMTARLKIDRVVAKKDIASKYLP